MHVEIPFDFLSRYMCCALVATEHKVCSPNFHDTRSVYSVFFVCHGYALPDKTISAVSVFL